MCQGIAVGLVGSAGVCWGLLPPSAGKGLRVGAGRWALENRDAVYIQWGCAEETSLFKQSGCLCPESDKIIELGTGCLLCSCSCGSQAESRLTMVGS